MTIDRCIEIAEDFVNQHAGFGPLLVPPDHAEAVTGLPVGLKDLAREIHQSNIDAGWWRVTDGITQAGNIGELLCLVHSEISEADSGDLMDDKLPHRKMFEVELGDASIRVLDILGYYGTDVDTIRYAVAVPTTRDEAHPADAPHGQRGNGRLPQGVGGARHQGIGEAARRDPLHRAA